MAKISKLTMLLLMLLAVCVFSRPANAETSIYVFDPNQSTVVKTGGFAGVHETYAVAGLFRLIVDPDAGVASFEIVDANLADETGSVYGRSLEEIFNMTALSGTVVDEMTIEFEGKTADGTESDVRLKLSFSKGPAHLTGKTTPPPNSADMFFYDVNTVAVRKYAGGTGEPNEPYQIATAEDLMLLGETPEDYDKHFILTADIDLDPNLPSRKIFDKAVIAPENIYDDPEVFGGTSFSGHFDGNSHVVRNLKIQGSRYLGLFGRLEVGAEITNLGLDAIDVNGTGDYVGGLVGCNIGSEIVACNSSGMICGGSYVAGLAGWNFGNISSSFSNGTVDGNSFDVGGLVGSNSGSITKSYSTGTITGYVNVGGLVGSNIVGPGTRLEGPEYIGSITASYSTSTVIGYGRAIGGLVGKNQGGISACYSMGMVSSDKEGGGLVGLTYAISDTALSFWDIQTSGQNKSADGIGLTTAEIQMAGTFLAAGWDFVGETVNGTKDIWSICEGTNYPRFVWQIPVGDFVCPDGITIDDFMFFMEHWLDDNCDLNNGYCQGTDLDQSGTVDVNDLEILIENWLAEK